MRGRDEQGRGPKEEPDRESRRAYHGQSTVSTGRWRRGERSASLHSPLMSWTSFSGPWSASQVPAQDVRQLFSVTIPGSIHLGLLENGLIAEPTLGKNELATAWVAKSDWMLSRALPALPDRKHHVLVCEGVDTHATAYIHDQIVGTMASEFVKYEFDLDAIKFSAQSAIRFDLHSPTQYCNTKSVEYASTYGYQVPCSHYVNGIANFNFIRKCACSFAWDWGPSVPTLGINKIGIVSFDNGYIKDVKCLVKPAAAEGKWRVRVSAFLHWLSPTPPTLIVDLVVIDTNRAVASTILRHNGPWTQNFETEFEVAVPAWRVACASNTLPNTLYRVQVHLVEEAQIVSRAVGFRKIELIRRADFQETSPSGLPLGESFYLQVNGVPVFAKGSNYIPPNVFAQRNRQDSLQLLAAAKDAGMNCLRIWGGGRYEEDAFYDECDRLGILLWHDFMFACSLYPSDPAFLVLVRSEIQTQLRRLAGHPCIAIWAGNNENEELLEAKMLEYPADKTRFLADYQKLYLDTIWPVYVEEMAFLDGSKEEDRKASIVVPFWPSSPSNGIGAWGIPGDPTRGDIHYWGVWHGNKPFDAYDTVRPRFCSEFGFQSAPTYRLLREQIESWPSSGNGSSKSADNVDDELNWTAPAIEYLQRSPARGNLGLISQMMSHLRLPTSFAKQVWASQLLQGQAMERGISSWRRLQPYCMGALYWQLNDIWTGMSWSTINHSGVWKLSHHLVRRAFKPIVLSFKFVPSPNAPVPTPTTEDPPFNVDDTLEAWLVADPDVVNSDKRSFWLLVEAWSTSSDSGRHEASYAVESIKLSLEAQMVWKMSDLGFLDKHDTVIRGRLFDENDQVVFDTQFFFVPIKRLRLRDPSIELSVTTQSVSGSPHIYTVETTLSATRVCLFASLEELTTTYGGAWSDNGLVLYPKSPVTVSAQIDERSWVLGGVPAAAPIKDRLLATLNHVQASYQVQ